MTAAQDQSRTPPAAPGSDVASLSFMSVSKWYGQISALSEVSFDVEPGVTGLVGQNGAGKSTIMKLAVGLSRPSQGEVLLSGGSPCDPGVRRTLGYCSDLDRYYERVSGRRFVTWMLRLQGFGAGQAAARAAETLEEFGLADAMDRAIGGYSKGMRQRVKLAQALAHEPKVVLLDEPLTGLDPVARHDIVELIRSLGERGKAILISSHVLHELQDVAEQFLLVHQGRLLAEGGLGELREQIEGRPRQIALRSRQPRAVAARLCTMPEIIGVRLTDDGIQVETKGGSDLFGRLTRIGAEAGGLIEEIHPVDDNLEAVFEYLTS